MSFISRLRRSRQHRVSILSAYLVHPFPLRGTSPQGETRALRDLLFCIIWHDKHSADWLAALASPYPASPDFPRKRGQNKTPRNILFINGSTVSTGYSATVHILHRMCKLVKVSPKPAHKRAFILIDQPNCGGSPAKRARGKPLLERSEVGLFSIARQGGCQGFNI